MAFSKITLTFNSQPAADTVITITDSLRPSIAMTEAFKLVDTGLAEIKISTTTAGTAANYRGGFHVDYNTTALYTFNNVSPTVLEITSTNAQSSFTVDANTTAGAVTTSISNETPPNVFAFDTVVISEATDPCNDVKFTVTTTEQATSIEYPINQAVATNPFVFETVRSDKTTLYMSNANGSDIEKYRIPQLLSTYIDIDIVNTPNGATVNVNRLFPLSDSGNHVFPLTFEYSLNNVDWQESNSWSNIAPDDYTLYIRDNIGCELSIDFTVDEFTPNLIDYDGIARISAINPIRFKENVSWSNCGILKNVTNTLSFEEDTKINRQDFLHLKQKCDTDTIQVDGNYDTVTAVLIDDQANETPLTVTQATENMNITDVRDGKIHLFEANKVAVYFGSGLTYDPITLEQNGSYVLGESLMSWINVGDYINIQGAGWLLVNGINAPTTEHPYYDVVIEGSNAVLGFTNNQNVQITTVYNTVNFERYEFEIDYAALEGFYHLKVNYTDTTFEDKEFLSEWISVKEQHKTHHYIEYYNSENNEINYATGVRYSLRIPYIVPLKWKPNEEQDIYIMDTRTVLLENTVRELYDLSFVPLPTAIAQQITLILNQDRIFINGVNYIKEGEIESNPIGSTNTYKINATLVKGDYIFNSNSSSETEEVIKTLSISATQEGYLLVE